MSSSTTLDEFKASILARLKGVEEKKAQAEKTRSDYIKLRNNINDRIDEVDEELSGLQSQIESGLKAISDLERIVQDEQKLQQTLITTETGRSEHVTKNRPESVVKSTGPRKLNQQKMTSNTVKSEITQSTKTVDKTAINSVEIAVKKDAKEEKNEDEEKSEKDPFVTEDGFPIMEIYEELDDDGNIICEFY